MRALATWSTELAIENGVEQILSDFDHSDASASLLNEPLTDEEMGIPGGRLPTKAQLDEWLDREEGPDMTGDEALAYIKKRSEELKGG